MNIRNSTLKIGLVQMFCEKANITRNLENHSERIDEAERKGIDILVFPEASITGYIDRGGHPEAIIRRDGPEIEELRKKTSGRKVTVLAGFIEANPGGKPFVTQVAIQDSRITGYFRKMTIVDDDVEWFTPGDATPVSTFGGLKYGIAICSDICNEAVFAGYARQGAGIVFECAAPGLYGEQATRDWKSGYEWWEGVCREYLSRYARKYGLWITVATQSGRTIDEDFPGGGYVFSPDGERVYATGDWQPGVACLELNLQNGQVKEI
jgi:predicted amidohydrolase